jgi:hypothetical protein
MELGIIFFVIGIALFIAESTESSFFRYAVVDTPAKAKYNTTKQRLVYNAIVAFCMIVGFATILTVS